jgi:hypothetical protein
MKAASLLLSLTIFACAQTKPPVSQQASNCAQNFGSGSKDNTGTITCYSVDKKLADQISQLVAASVRDAKALNKITDKLDVLLREVQGQVSGSLNQSNFGGTNVQQGTTGNNSPIINSPITVGDVPKAIQPQDMDALKTFFLSAATKAKVQISADQISGTVPFPDDFYDALKGGGWSMVDAGVSHPVMLAGPGRRFQGAVLITKGDPLAPNETVRFAVSDPIVYIFRALDAFMVPRSLQRNPTQEDGLIIISFQGGFPH